MTENLTPLPANLDPDTGLSWVPLEEGDDPTPEEMDYHDPDESEEDR